MADPVTRPARSKLCAKRCVAGVAEIGEPIRRQMGAAIDTLAMRSAGQITSGALTDFRIFRPYGRSPAQVWQAFLNRTYTDTVNVVLTY